MGQSARHLVPQMIERKRVQMLFHEQLCKYIEEIGITQHELSAASGLGDATISRYCSGERQPKENSRQLRKLAKGLAELAAKEKSKEKTSDKVTAEGKTSNKATAGEKMSNKAAAGEDSGQSRPEAPSGYVLSENEIFQVLNAIVCEGPVVDYDTFLANLNALMKALDLKTSDLAKALKYDPSHISKILSGSRRPGNLRAFITDTASYVARHFTDSRDIRVIEELTGGPQKPADTGTAPAGTGGKQPGSEAARQERLMTWLCSNPAVRADEPISRFLEKLDEFDLGDYLKAVHFDEIKMPPALFQLPLQKTYYGLNNMMESELDFIKTTVLSKFMEDCILYSDMPIQDMAKDADFSKKWMFGMGVMLKKGLHLHIIHDINRPFSEMMLGLEGNIPIYMTGQISPYYLPSAPGNVFSHLLKVFGAAALEGSAIVGHQASGKYTLYRRKEEIKYYRKRAQELLRKARPLMDIYREDRKQEYLSKYARYPEGEEIRIVCSQMPVSTMSHALLLSVLERSSLPEAAGEEILDYWAAGREALEAQIQHGTVHIIIPHLTREQFAQSPLSLSLSDLFLEAEPVYTYEDYCRHLEETCAMAQTAGNAAAESTAAESDAAGNAAAESQVEASRTNHTTASPNSADGRLLVELNPNPAFCNISYTVAGDKYVIVSKEKSPVIHFVIHHKRMIQAFQRFIPSSTD